MKIKLTLLLLLVVPCAIAQNRAQQLDSLLESMYTNKTINGNFLVAEKGVVIYKKSFGLADESTKEKLNDSSVFELASVSKQFTAMAVALLEEQGKLHYTDQLSKWIPALSGYKNITIKNLVNHTSGLPDYMELMDSVFDKSKIATNGDVITLFAKHQPAILFAPNTKWEYSNTGYALLASIIEKASGMNYGAFLQKEIFSPLGMTHTFVYTRRYAPKKINNYAYGYVYADSLKKHVLPDDLAATKMVVWLDGIVGDGTVNSTTADLLKWDRALYTNKLLPKTGMKQLYSTDTLNDGSKTNYTFGWFVDNHADFGKTASHSGGWPGYRTYIDRHIENDKTIIMLLNHDDGKNPIQSIRNILYNKPLPIPKTRKEVTLKIEQLQKFVGAYELRESLVMNIFLKNNQLFGQVKTQDPFPLFAETETQFFLKVVDAEIHFKQNEAGVVSSFELLQNGKNTEAKKIR